MYFITIKKKKEVEIYLHVCLYRYKISLDGYLRNVKWLAPTGREYGWLENLEERTLHYTPFRYLNFEPRYWLPPRKLNICTKNVHST